MDQGFPVFVGPVHDELEGWKAFVRVEFQLALFGTRYSDAPPRLTPSWVVPRRRGGSGEGADNPSNVEITNANVNPAVGNARTQLPTLNLGLTVGDLQASEGGEPGGVRPEPRISGRLIWLKLVSER